MGADVIKVEPPGGAFERHWAGAKAFIDGLSAFYLAANRNKRGIAVDLKHPDGKTVIARLLERADVLMENFRPGTMERLGLGYEQVRAIRPDIIYASATGLRQLRADGRAARPGPADPGLFRPDRRRPAICTSARCRSALPPPTSMAARCSRWASSAPTSRSSGPAAAPASRRAS